MAAGQSRPIDRILNVLVSAAAVPVLLGALFKIIHAPSADIWLKIGLYTEAGIFLSYALLYLLAPPPEPGLPVAATAAAPNALGAMNKALAEADITPANLNRLGEGFKTLNTTISNMSKVADVVASTNDYTQKTKEVTSALAQVKDAYVSAANSVTAFNSASESTKVFHDQVQVLTKNLSSLNTIYELELQESNNHLKALNSFYGRLAETSNAMLTSAEDAKKVQTELSSLSGNLGRLNGIYGNMLSAMQGR
jgi:gliding motility-associated protein GldL